MLGKKKQDRVLSTVQWVPGETLLTATSCNASAPVKAPGYVAATTHRIVFASSILGTIEQVSIPWEQVTGISVSDGLQYRLQVDTDSDSLRVTAMSKSGRDELQRACADQVARWQAPPPPPQRAKAPGWISEAISDLGRL